MDALDKLVVRFHFNGEFIFDGNNTHYVDGSEALSYIDHEKVSLDEICGHLKDHCEVAEGALFHWCFPGKSMTDGLRVLHAEKSCRLMSDCTAARVATIPGGTATMSLHAHGRSAHATSNVTITVTSGTASAHVQTHEPDARGSTPQRKTRLPQLLLSPPRSDGNEN